MRARRLFVLSGVTAFLMLAMAGTKPAVLTGAQPERYTALAVNMGEPVRWSTLNVEMVVERWSTDGERDRLLGVLTEQGPEKLLDVLRKSPRVGYIRTPDRVGYDLHFARRTPGEDGGERVVLVTDRYIDIWEARNRPRTVDYPFTVIELRIKPNGEGEGKASIFTRIEADKAANTITLENFGTQPTLLQGVRKQ